MDQQPGLKPGNCERKIASVEPSYSPSHERHTRHACIDGGGPCRKGRALASDYADLSIANDEDGRWLTALVENICALPDVAMTVAGTRQ